jgi:DNA-binding MarR family transcriptional regulator
MSVKDWLRKPYQVLRNASQVFRYETNRKLTRNPKASKQFQQSEHVLSPTQNAVLTCLRNEGYATIPLADLLGDRAIEVLPGVKQVVDRFINSDYVRAEERHYQENFKQLTGKDYVVRYYQKKKERRLDDPVFRLGLDPAILEVVNNYAKMNMLYQGNDIWYTIPLAEERPRTTSQNWHRDYEDEVLVKVFLYCNEVGPRTGPFEYVRNSRRGERNHFVSTLANGIIKDGFYPPESLVEAKIPAADYLTCTCAPYTLLFCDTSGLHRGGFAYDSPRIVATWTYVTPASLVERVFTLPASDEFQQLLPAQHAALIGNP